MTGLRSRWSPATSFHVSFVIILIVSTFSTMSWAQQIFETPELAAKALLDSARDGDKGRSEKILGRKGADLLRTHNIAADTIALQRIVVDAGHGFEVISLTETSRSLIIGVTRWTFPIPIVQTRRGWQFDSGKGEAELSKRLIAFNEASAIKACEAYVSAQQTFHDMNRGANSSREYARRVVSSPGKRDGLYWEPQSNSDVSPLTNFVIEAPRSWRLKENGIYNGYRFKILTRQGEAAPGGAATYLIDGRMTAGHALVAYPDLWGKTGIRTFMCGKDGIVFQKNLGRRGGMVEIFNPDDSWVRAN